MTPVPKAHPVSGHNSIRPSATAINNLIGWRWIQVLDRVGFCFFFLFFSFLSLWFCFCCPLGGSQQIHSALSSAGGGGWFQWYWCGFFLKSVGWCPNSFQWIQTADPVPWSSMNSTSSARWGRWISVRFPVRLPVRFPDRFPDRLPASRTNWEWPGTYSLSFHTAPSWFH